jgi:hypothetical protein
MAEYPAGQAPPPLAEDWGFPAHLTSLQLARLADFRAAIQASPECRQVGDWPDAQLLRFMRARDFAPKKALKMLQDDLSWRALLEGRKITRSMVESLVPFQLNRLVRVAGRDRSGRPVVVLRNGEFFPWKVHDSLEIVHFFIVYVEGLIQLTEACGFSEFTAIADMTGWSLTENFSLPVSQLLAQLLQDHFPERLRYAFVVNNPWAFSAAWNLISPFLEDRVKAKVHVWGKKKERLLEYISPEMLEQEFGGSRPTNYPIPDELTKPLIDGETMVVGKFGGISVLPKDAPPSPSPALRSIGSTAEDGDEDTDDDADASSPPLAAGGGKPPHPPSRLVRQQSSTMRRVELLRSRVGNSFRRAMRKSGSEADNDPPSSPLRAPALQRSLSSTPAPEDRPAEQIPEKPRKRVTVFGATGRTGRLVALSLLDKDVDVSALVRVNGSSLRPDLMARSNGSASSATLQVFVGSFSSPVDIDRALEGADAVAWCIGAQPALSGDQTEQLVAVANGLLDAMERCQVRRLVLVSSAHVEDTWWEGGAGCVLFF